MKLSRMLLGERLNAWVMKKTVYGQFVAGEDISAIKQKVDQLHKSGVYSILDYAVEEDLGNEEEAVMEAPQADTSHPYPHQVMSEADTCTHHYAKEEVYEENVNHFISGIEMVANASAPGQCADAFAAIKLTSLGRVNILVSFVHW